MAEVIENFALSDSRVDHLHQQPSEIFEGF
jgi:hypothetical protein